MVPLRHRLANTIAPAASDTARANRLLAGQLRVTEMIAGDAPVLAPLTALAHLMEELVPSSIAGATILNRAGRSFEQAVFPSLPDSFSQALVGVTVEPPHAGACAAAVYRGDTVTSEHVAGDARFAEGWRALCLQNDIKSLQSKPALASDGTPLGTFVLCFREPREAVSWDPELMAIGARLVGLALECSRTRDGQELLIGELRHRMRNVFTVISSIAQFTFRSPEAKALGAVFEGRLTALARAHSVAEDQSDLATVISDVLAPYRGDWHVGISGPQVTLSSNATQAFGMALHELATNAAKYGALSSEQGSLSVAWSLIDRGGGEANFELKWVESNVENVVAPTRTGFGTSVIERNLSQAIDASVVLDFTRDGLHCTVTAPFSERLGASIRHGAARSSAQAATADYQR